MYEKILNPITNEFVSIKSSEGKRILKHYKIYYNKNGGFWNPFRKKKKDGEKKKKKKKSRFGKFLKGVGTAAALAGTAYLANETRKRFSQNKKKSKEKSENIVKSQNNSAIVAVPDFDADDINTSTSLNTANIPTYNLEDVPDKNKKCNELNTKIKEIDNIGFYQNIQKINEEKEQLQCENNTELDKSMSNRKKEFNEYVTKLITKCNKCLSSN